MAEKIVLSASLDKSIKTCLSIVRYGNVMTSRGSVIPLFINQIKHNKKITITDKKMTRFLLNLDSAIELVKYSLKSKLTGNIFIKKAPSAFVQDIAEALYEIMSIRDKKYEFIGIRPGEKINETLISFEESRYTKEFKNFYMIYNSLSEESFMNFFSKGIKSSLFTYSSDMMTNLIDKIELKKLIKKTLNNKKKDELE